MPENYHEDCDDADELIDALKKEVERLREAEEICLKYHNARAKVMQENDRLRAERLQLLADLDAARSEAQKYRAEVERLRAKAEEWHRVANEGVRVMRTQAMEVERLRALIDKMTGQKFYSRLSDAEAEVERLRSALNRAGDRLAQVQPGVTEPWAYDIVPKAEQEIADALAEEKV
jgi:chromosome segregation ATPase